MVRKKIVWVTNDCFVDCDIPYVPLLLDSFNIYWVVILPNHSRYHKDDFLALCNSYSNLSVEFIISTTRERYPSKLFEYLKINEIVRREKPDLVYANLIPTSPWHVPMFLGLPKSKTIITAHQGEVHDGFSYKWIHKCLRRIVYGYLRNINMFSKSQASLMKLHFPKAHIYQMVLGLKDFGVPTNTRPNDGIVRFLSFGIISRTKHVDLLCDAACMLYEQGYRNFKVVVKGECSMKNEFMEHVRYPDIFEIDLRFVDNGEIPNMFNGCHYFVQPYSIVTQSGPMKIAFKYNVPDIVSNLPGFTDEIEEGVNGFVFNTDNAEDLACVMKGLIDNHENCYHGLLNKMADYTHEKYSEEAIAANYIEMFNDVIGKSSKL